MARQWLAAALVASVPVLCAAQADAAVVSITQARVNQGSVTPGDAPGFPVTISRSGSYRLDTNLDFTSAAADKTGIEIRANDVTINFNGFRLQGWNLGGIGIDGDDFDTARIRNGLVAGFKRLGILGRNYWTVEDMQILVNGRGGIDLGSEARVQRNTISQNRETGVTCTRPCLVDGNIISNNHGVGVDLTGGTVLGNTIMFNKYIGIRGVNVHGLVGYGNNTLYGNNSGGGQVAGAVELAPNNCSPSC